MALEEAKKTTPEDVAGLIDLFSNINVGIKDLGNDKVVIVVIFIFVGNPP